jgi:hypothetical protein
VISRNEEAVEMRGMDMREEQNNEESNEEDFKLEQSRM